MGSAVSVVKQRTERHGKTSMHKRMVTNLKVHPSSPTPDKYEPSLQNEHKLRSSVSANCNGKGKPPCQTEVHNGDPSNRKKSRLRNRLKMLTFFRTTNDEHTDDVSFIDLEQSPNSGQNKNIALQQGIPEKGAFCRSHGDSNLTIVQSIDLQNPSVNTTNSSPKKEMTKEVDSTIETPTLSLKKSASDALDDKDVCRDARTPSPQFDEIDNVKLVPLNQTTKLNVTPEESRKLLPNEVDNCEDEDETIEECIDSHLEETDATNTRDGEDASCPPVAVHTHKYPSPSSRSSPDKCAVHQDDQRVNKSPKTSAKGPGGNFDSPTVNNPVVENVLTSGEDFVDGLDDKFVLRGNLTPRDLKGETATDEEEHGDGFCGRQGSPEAQLSENGRSPSPTDGEEEAKEDNFEGSDNMAYQAYAVQKNNSQTANYDAGPYRNGLSIEKIECIQRQVYQEGLAPSWTDGGVSFFVPVEESGMRPPSVSATYPSRLKVSRKSGLSCDERMILADVNRKKHLDKRKEFAVKQNQSVTKFVTGKDEDDDDPRSQIGTRARFNDYLDEA